MGDLSHINNRNEPTMVDVSEKNITARTAIASSTIVLGQEIMALLENGELNGPKGPVFQTAIIAGTQAVKKTSELIPFCHPLLITSIKFSIEVIDNKSIEIICTVKCEGKTGIEMEALTGASVAALCVYDMCKALSHNIIIKQTKLLEKTGGKSHFVAKD